jgi:hypothetical protein
MIASPLGNAHFHVIFHILSQIDHFIIHLHVIEQLTFLVFLIEKRMSRGVNSLHELGVLIWQDNCGRSQVIALVNISCRPFYSALRVQL